MSSRARPTCTAATAGEGRNVQYVGEALCSLLEAAGWRGDRGMVEPWAQLLVDFRARYAFGSLLPFESVQAATHPEVLQAFGFASLGDLVRYAAAQPPDACPPDL